MGYNTLVAKYELKVAEVGPLGRALARVRVLGVLEDTMEKAPDCAKPIFRQAMDSFMAVSLAQGLADETPDLMQELENKEGWTTVIELDPD